MLGFNIFSSHKFHGIMFSFMQSSFQLFYLFFRQFLSQLRYLKQNIIFFLAFLYSRFIDKIINKIQ